MKIIELANDVVRCGYCKSLLKIEPYDLLSESTDLGRYICMFITYVMYVKLKIIMFQRFLKKEKNKSIKEE